MLRIGLTGGIASGKSTVAQLFAAHGATVIDTDAIAREGVEPRTPGPPALVSALGGALADAATRREVEAILHPAIVAGLERQSRQAPGPYQVFVIPLLVESRLERIVN